MFAKKLFGNKEGKASFTYSRRPAEQEMRHIFAFYKGFYFLDYFLLTMYLVKRAGAVFFSPDSRGHEVLGREGIYKVCEF